MEGQMLSHKGRGQTQGLRETHTLSGVGPACCNLSLCPADSRNPIVYEANKTRALISVHTPLPYPPTSSLVELKNITKSEPAWMRGWETAKSEECLSCMRENQKPCSVCL